jgi:hypothetical protein
MKLINVSLQESLGQKAKFFLNLFLKTVLLMVYIRTDPKTEPERQLVRSRKRNRNISKVGTGTVRNSYGSTTLPLRR